MKKVLLLTNIYPNNDPDYDGTAVCHSFTTEWVKMGYAVRVIHFESLFPKAFYWVAKRFNKWIQAKTGAVAYTKTPRQPSEYYVDEVPVLMIPLKKVIPHKSPGARLIKEAFGYLMQYLKKHDFVPDIITGHFVLPQLEFIHLLKASFPQAKTCLVLHSDGSKIMDAYPSRYADLMQSVDIWGFRSAAFRSAFEDIFHMHPKSFLCYSGIPERYLDTQRKDLSQGVSKFVFVGSLFQLKKVDVTLQALAQAMGPNPFSFKIVGSGAEEGNLKNLTKDLGLEEQVSFVGQKTRDEAQDYFAAADCFIMVSSREAFGLVYVEAMAKGCIVIGTRGQGIDGIVIDGKNGFLCPSDDVDALARLIKKICAMPVRELQDISDQAIITARTLSDRCVAEHYLQEISGAN